MIGDLSTYSIHMCVCLRKYQGHERVAISVILPAYVMHSLGVLCKYILLFY